MPLRQLVRLYKLMTIERQLEGDSKDNGLYDRPLV